MNSEHYVPPYTRTNIYKFSFLPRAIVNWNSRPQRAVDIAGDSQFRECRPLAVAVRVYLYQVVSKIKLK